uniref:Putative secreted protein n=1 Tax=Ixodes ricinus TaxID=34613 RepID=A0A6B0U5L0_IXORI
MPGPPTVVSFISSSLVAHLVTVSKASSSTDLPDCSLASTPFSFVINGFRGAGTGFNSEAFTCFITRRSTSETDHGKL